MTDHGGRAHATWSASSTARNWACAGALALGEAVDKLDVESEAAAWGTACHQVAEKCLRQNVDAESLIGTTEKTKRFSFEVDAEMAETAQVYVDYVRERTFGDNLEPHPKCQLWIEERFSLESLKPPFDAGGTCDAVIYNPDRKLLEVVDLKGGRGLKVDVNGHKQLRTYALGAMLAHPDLEVERVKVTIVQPRMGDGLPKSEEFHVFDLVEWTGELRKKMNLSAEAIAAYKQIKGALMREAWAEKYIVAGSHCTFCPAEGICPAREKKALEVASAFFTDAGKVEIPNQPSDLDPARIATVLDGADDLQNWLNAVRALGTRLAQTGTTIPGYFLTDRIGNRKFKGEYPAEQLEKIGLTKDEIYTLAMRSPAQMEKTLGAKRMREVGKDKFDALIHRPITGQSLVSAAKSTKKPTASQAEKFFGA